MADGVNDRTSPEVPSTPIVVSVEPASALLVGAGFLGLLVVFAFASSASRALTLVGVGVLLAFALEPLVKGVQRRLHCSRVIGVAVVGGLLVAVFAGLVLLMGPPAARQAQQFGKELPATVQDLYRLPIVGDRLAKADTAEKVQRWAEELPGRLTGDRVRRTAKTVVSGLVAGATVILVAVVVLLDGEVLVRRMRRVVPARHRPRADAVGRVFYRVVGTYFAGSLLVACIGGVYVLAVGLLLGVPLAPVAAVWYAVVSLIPQVGGFLGVSFFTVLALSQGVFIGLIGLVLLVLYMNLENYVITPGIVGQSVNLSPPTTMIAALIGGAAIGVPGALAATPLCGTVKALYLEYRFGEQADYGRKRPSLFDRLKVSGLVARLRGRRGPTSSEPG